MNLELTDEQGQAAIELFDLAVKSGGLRVAQAAVVLTNMIVKAKKDSQQQGGAEAFKDQSMRTALDNGEIVVDETDLPGRG